VKAMDAAPHFRLNYLATVDWDRVDLPLTRRPPARQTASQAAGDADTAPLFSIEEILAAGRRIEPEAVDDVRALRPRLGLRQYESHRRTPTGPARTLLRAIAREPDAVIRALAGGS
jgi:hypothetical protein